MQTEKFSVHSESSFAILIKVEVQNPKSSLKLQIIFHLTLEL